VSGGKIKGEYCDDHSECKSNLYCINNQCADSFFAFLPRDVILLVIIIAAAIIGLSIIIYCCFKLCSTKNTKNNSVKPRRNSNEGSPCGARANLLDQN